MIWTSQRAHRKQYNFSKQTSQLFSQTTESEVTKRPGSRVQIPLGSLPGRLFPCLKRSIASRVRLGQPRLEAVLYPASGSGPASRPSPTSSTPLSRALRAQTSCEHVGPWVVSNHIEFICIRESSDSADPFISATAIQLTPSYTTVGLSCIFSVPTACHQCQRQLLSYGVPAHPNGQMHCEPTKAIQKLME